MSMKGQRFCIEGVCRGLSLNLMSQMPYRRVNDQGPAQLPSASQPASHAGPRPYFLHPLHSQSMWPGQ